MVGALRRAEPLPVHDECIALRFPTENRMVLQNEASKLRVLCLKLSAVASPLMPPPTIM